LRAFCGRHTISTCIRAGALEMSDGRYDHAWACAPSPRPTAWRRTSIPSIPGARASPRKPTARRFRRAAALFRKGRTMPGFLDELVTAQLCPALHSTAPLCARCYFFIFVAVRLTASTLTCPVRSLIVPSVAFGENWGMGLGRFLFRVSLRFCCISPAFGGVLSR
jgi:hypothetical protein